MSYSIIFMGTPDFAKQALQSILQAGYNVIGVYTQAPKPTGRKQVCQKSAVHQLAENSGISVYTPKSLKKEEVINEIRAQNPDLIIVAAYGFIIPESILSIPKYGCINIHASILPRWRGAAPIQHAIMAGDDETGITVMKMDAGMDTGDIIDIKKVPISSNTTYIDLLSDLSSLGAEMIVDVLCDLDSKLRNAYKQPEDGVTTAGKITKSMEQIDWNKPSVEIQNNIRAFYPSPAMWSQIHGIRLKILSARVVSEVSNVDAGTVLNTNFVVQCGDRTHLQLLEVQPSGKSAMSAKSFINGHQCIIGDKFIYEEVC